MSIHDHLFGTTFGLRADQVAPWAESCRASGFTGRVHLFTYDRDPSLVRGLGDLAASFSVELIPVSDLVSPRQLNKERYQLYGQLMDRLGLRTERVITSDVRDLVFQTNPSDWLNAHLLSYDVVTSSEGIAVGDDDWNKSCTVKAYGDSGYQAVRREPVLNGGLLAGRAGALRRLFEEIYAECYLAPQNPSDQVILRSVISRGGAYRVLATDHRDSWACHCGNLKNPKRTDPVPIVEDGRFYTSSRELYVVVHQYDRAEIVPCLPGSPDSSRKRLRAAKPPRPADAPVKITPAPAATASITPSAPRAKIVEDVPLKDRKIILTTGSMNRLEPLRRSLVTWVKLPEVSRILIVDWGCRDPLRRALLDHLLEDDRLVIARVEASHWQNSRCHNLELQLAADFDLLLRVDNDVLVAPDFFSRHPMRSSHFYCGNWRNVPHEVDDKRNLTGTLFASPKDVLAAGGYNERLLLYGKEDDELYDRMSASGLVRLDVDLESLDHIPHPDATRFENLAMKSGEVAAVYKAVRKMREVPDARTAYLAISDHVIAEHPWTRADHPTRWHIEKKCENYWECTEEKS